MTPAAISLGDMLAVIVYLAGAVLALTIAVWLWPRRLRFGAAGPALIAALALTALWSIAVVAFGDHAALAQIAETARNLGWLFVTYRLFMTDGRHASVAPIRPVA